jgi:hypothetical protein
MELSFELNENGSILGENGDIVQQSLMLEKLVLGKVIVTKILVDYSNTINPQTNCPTKCFIVMNIEEKKINQIAQVINERIIQQPLLLKYKEKLLKKCAKLNIEKALPIIAKYEFKIHKSKIINKKRIIINKLQKKVSLIFSHLLDRLYYLFTGQLRGSFWFKKSHK